MSKKQKKLFKILIAINVFLVIVVVWGYIIINFATEQLLIEVVQVNLIELEGLIEHQIDNEWSEPNLVTTKFPLHLLLDEGVTFRR